MTEEEKKQIQIINNLIMYCRGFEDKKFTEQELFKAIEDTYILIQKQQEELEDYKMEYNHWCQLAIDRKKEIEKKDKIINKLKEKTSGGNMETS